jgi:hypothetical protein
VDAIERQKPKRRRRWFWLLLLIVDLPFGLHWYVTAALLLFSLVVTLLLSREGHGG